MHVCPAQFLILHPLLLPRFLKSKGYTVAGKWPGRACSQLAKTERAHAQARGKCITQEARRWMTGTAVGRMRSSLTQSGHRGRTRVLVVRATTRFWKCQSFLRAQPPTGCRHPQLQARALCLQQMQSTDRPVHCRTEDGLAMMYGHVAMMYGLQYPNLLYSSCCQAI